MVGGERRRLKEEKRKAGGGKMEEWSEREGLADIREGKRWRSGRGEGKGRGGGRGGKEDEWSGHLSWGIGLVAACWGHFRSRMWLEMTTRGDKEGK